MTCEIKQSRRKRKIKLRTEKSKIYNIYQADELFLVLSENTNNRNEDRKKKRYEMCKFKKGNK